MNPLHLVLPVAALSSLFSCGPEPIDPHRQIGSNPYLPEIHQYLVPPMHVVKIVGWKEDETPSVPAGLQVKALAKDLKNPRSLYVLPNGDLLIVETQGPEAPVSRPKEFVMNWVEKQSHSSTKAGNRIVLVREGSDGNTAMRTVFLDHLNSPFGVVLV